MSLATAKRGEGYLIAFFSAPSRVFDWFKGQHIVAPDKTRNLFGSHRGVGFVLNPGSNFGKVFTPTEVEYLLAGNFMPRQADYGWRKTQFERCHQSHLYYQVREPISA